MHNDFVGGLFGSKTSNSVLVGAPGVENGNMTMGSVPSLYAAHLTLG